MLVLYYKIAIADFLKQTAFAELYVFLGKTLEPKCLNQSTRMN